MSSNPYPSQEGTKIGAPLISPGKPKTSSPRRGLILQVMLALAYVAIIPLVTFASLMALTTYLPDQTRIVLGPILSKLVEKAEEPQLEVKIETLLEEKTAPLSDRVGKMEKDIKEIMANAQKTQAPPEGPGAAAPVDEAKRQEFLKMIGAMEEKTRVLGSLSAITAARIEYSRGNMQRCEKELNSAKILLDKAGSIPDETRNILQKAIEEVKRGSVQAEDWLSLCWHSLYEQLENTGSTLK